MNLTWQAAAAIAIVMGLTWLASLVTGNASVVDLVWGLGFVVVGWTTWSIHPDPGPLQHLTIALVSIWGIRLTGYLAWRNRGHGEDFRYRTMREKWGRTFWIVSLGTVFALQGAIMWVVSLPLQIVNGTDEGRRLGVLAVVGALIWLAGFVFEAVGDAQLARFKADPANSDKVMDRGLWAWTRHPNYFGDACVWWGLGIIALSVGRPGVVALIGPATMNLFLVQVSGKALLERSLLRRRAGYDQYVARTSGFLPRPPRSP